MNKVILAGELTRKAYMSETNKGNKKALFTLKVVEKDKNDKYIPLEAYGKTAELVERLDSGIRLEVEGTLFTYKSTKYDQFILGVYADKVEFVTPEATETTRNNHSSSIDSSWVNSVDMSEDDLPF